MTRVAVARWFALVGVLTVAWWAPSAAGTTQQTIQGEVVDPAAYLKDGHHGMEAESQTYEAVDGGQTLALLENGTDTLYVFLADEPGEDPNELVYDYVNRQVTVTGTVYTRSGMHGIVAATVKPVEPAGGAPKPSGPAAPSPNPAGGT